MKTTADHIFTKTRFGLDKRVWLTMAVTVLVSLALLGYKMADRPRCALFEVKSSGLSAGSPDQYFTGSEVGFYVSTPGSNTVTWNFADGTKEATGAYVRHAFSADGIFMVSATVNGRCSNEIRVVIKKQAPVKSTDPVAEEGLIIGSDAPEAGHPVGYISKVKAASYEWIVQDNPAYPVQSSEMATITFKTPGMYVLLLKLHHPDKTSSKVINAMAAAAPKPGPAFPVMPSPPPAAGARQHPKEDGTAFPDLSGPVEVENNEGGASGEGNDNELTGMLREVTEGKRELQSFNKYLCKGGGTKVLSNNGKWDSFAAFFEKIRGKKAYNITAVRAERDEANCITVLKVTYKKKGIFDFIKPK